MRKILIAAFLAGFSLLSPANTFAFENYKIISRGLTLNVQARELIAAQVKSGTTTRGAALAILQNGDYLLGGGNNGNQIFIYDTQMKQLTNLGAVFSQQATNDARFAITDIEPLVESASDIKALVSFPKLQAPANCVRVQVDLVEIDLVEKEVQTQGTWFTSDPCVPISAVQHASGKMQKIDENSAYLTVGDLGFRQLLNREARGDLTSVFRISQNENEKITLGHRNAQGIVLYRNKYLLTSEHGPRGGDELNLIKANTDYGWPFVTLGTEYSPGDYIIPDKINTHEGYEKPMMYWVPSIAPTDLVELPINSNWKRWSGQLLMGTLREESLVRIYLNNDLHPTAQDFIKVNERIRGLEVSNTGLVVATTDSGKLLEISPS